MPERETVARDAGAAVRSLQGDKKEAEFFCSASLLFGYRTFHQAIQLVSSFIEPSGVKRSNCAEAGTSTVSP